MWSNIKRAKYMFIQPFMVVCMIGLIALRMEEIPPNILSTVDINQLQDGDIIFRQGHSFVSRVVLTLDSESAYSHAGLIQKNQQGCFIIHAVSGESVDGKDTVVCEPLETFLQKDRASAAAIYRLREPDRQRCVAAVERAQEYAVQRIPFDDDFDLYSADKLYCTELVWRAYHEAGTDLIDGRFDRLSIPFRAGDCILPSTLMKSDKLQCVCLLKFQ
jgi:hypothetical protein